MKEISEALSDAILTVCNKVVNKAKFDKTYRCRVISKISDGKYLVMKDNVEHVVSGVFEYNENDIVTVLLPQNSWTNAAIVYPQNISNLTAELTKLFNDIYYTWQSVLMPDNRDYNSDPQWYFTNYPRRMTVEFKLIEVIGLTSLSDYTPYTPLITFTPWGDSSGGYPRQIAWSANTMYQRVGVSNIEWGDWIALG